MFVPSRKKVFDPACRSSGAESSRGMAFVRRASLQWGGYAADNLTGPCPHPHQLHAADYTLTSGSTKYTPWGLTSS